jgi:hypothetical protein
MYHSMGLLIELGDVSAGAKLSSFREKSEARQQNISALGQA